MSNPKSSATATAMVKGRALEGMIEVEPGVYTVKRSTSIFLHDEGDDDELDEQKQGSESPTNCEIKER